MKAKIVTTQYSTRCEIFYPSGERYVCYNCGEQQFTWIQTDYVVCLDCGKQQPLELSWKRVDGEYIGVEMMPF
jgi:anaerobic ribonucleoside-triphosphate reductase